MADDNIVLDNFVFYLNDGELAVGIENMDLDIQEAVYDGKNTLYLKTAETREYILQNIVPEVREILTKSNAITVILLAKGAYQSAYEVSLKTDESRFQEDTFFDQAEKLYQYVNSQK